MAQFIILALCFQTQLDIDKALSEDPTVFDYDNVYDDIMGKKDEGSKTKKKKEIDKKVRRVAHKWHFAIFFP